MNLFNPYLIAHKGLRNILSKFLISIGSTDYNDQNALKKLKSLGDDLFMLLDSHSHLEESILLKELSNKINADELNDFNQHREISLLENRLKEKFYSLTIESSELEIHTFYLEFSSFYSQYLKHLYEEETETLALLQNKFGQEF